MKASIIIASVVTSIVLFTSCSTKHLTAQRSRQTEQYAENVSLNSRQNETLNSSRIISLRDSANHLYRVNIFPLDTFSFSIKDGFKGRASSIEVYGAEHRVKQFSDSAAFTAIKENDVQYNQESKSRKTTALNVKSVEKSKMIGTLMWIGLTGLIGWLGWRCYTQYKRF